jgi:hypothetical protein
MAVNAMLQRRLCDRPLLAAPPRPHSHLHSDEASDPLVRCLVDLYLRSTSLVSRSEINCVVVVSAFPQSLPFFLNSHVAFFDLLIYFYTITLVLASYKAATGSQHPSAAQPAAICTQHAQVSKKTLANSVTNQNFLFRTTALC